MIGNLHASLIASYPPSMWERKDWLQICFCVFVSYRYNAKVNFTEGRCPGSKAMDLGNALAQVTVPNGNIGDCDYTIAFWIRILYPFAGAEIYGWSRSGKLLELQPNGMSVTYCRAISTATLVYYTCLFVSSGVVMNN